MNQVLFRVRDSMELLSNQVLDPFPSRIDGKINGFAWGLEVNNGGRERERGSFLFWMSWCEEEEIVYHWEGRGRV